MKVFVGIGSFLILFAMLIVSFSHGMDLFESYGYRGLLAVLGTFAIEALYVLSESLVVYQKAHGQKLRKATIASFIFSSFMVGWSNVSSTSQYGKDGVVLGIAVPLTIGLSSALFLDIMSAAWEARKKAKGENTKTDILPDSNVDIQTVEQSADISLTSRTADQTTRQTDNVKKIIGQTDGQFIGQSSDSLTDMPDTIVNTTPASEPDSKSDTLENERTDTESNIQSTDESDKQSQDTPDSKLDTPSDSVKDRTEESDRRTDSEIEDRTARRTADESDTGRTKSDNKSDNVSEHPVTVAKRMRVELGDWPSIRKLAAEARISRHQADKILKGLRQQAS